MKTILDPTLSKDLLVHHDDPKIKMYNCRVV